MHPSIYLNHAGTSWPKPASVTQACLAALQADPNDWSSTFASGHNRLAEYFGIADPSRLLLTPGCTSSLSLALRDIGLQAGDCVVTSGFEHHALRGPLLKAVEQGIELRVIPPSPTGLFDLQRLDAALSESQVRLVAVTAACNVTGELLPIEEIADCAHRYGTRVLIDAAQVVGWQQYRLSASAFDLFAFGSHKGLQGPWGIGGLYVADSVPMQCLDATCELSPPGSGPQRLGSMPGYCDAGSVDRIALAGLQAGLDWLDQHAHNRLSVARAQCATLERCLGNLPGVSLLASASVQTRLPTVAFTVRGRDSTQVAAGLQERGIIVASGLQCAPSAHALLGTAESGAVRLSVGPMTSETEIAATCDALLSLG